MSTFITDEEIDALNAARSALAAISTRAFRHSNDTQASGMVYAKSETATDAIFSLLNWTNSYAHQEIASDKLHNIAPEPQSLRA
jgi:hypothetical protein